MAFIALLSICAGGADMKGIAVEFIRPVDFSSVTIDDAFWSPRLDRFKEVTLLVCIEQIETKMSRMRNFENAAAKNGKHSGIYFDDSNGKTLEYIPYYAWDNRAPGGMKVWVPLSEVAE